MAEFYERVPPGREVVISDPTATANNYGNRIVVLNTPHILLHCSHANCDGLRYFAYHSGRGSLRERDIELDNFITFKCRNCGNDTYTFAVRVRGKLGDEASVTARKLGQIPAFGPPLPGNLITLIRDEKELFFQGRRSEDQGLGIGAFVYYRRVIESQKARIFDAVIRAAKRLNATPDLLADLEEARKEQQFSKAVDHIKHALPDSLMISGQNPLSALHGPLSIGVHELSDGECLSAATQIRLVLVAFAEKLDTALKEQAELESAVSQLMNMRSSATNTTGTQQT